MKRLYIVTSTILPNIAIFDALLLPPSTLRIKIILFATFKNTIAAHKDKNTISLHKYIINGHIKILPVPNNLPLSVNYFFLFNGQRTLDLRKWSVPPHHAF